jgi:hypothetical protein
MVPLLVSVQAESMGGGTEKTDYRNLRVAILGDQGRK